MPTRDIPKAPADALCITAKKIAHYLGRYKATRNAADYYHASTAINEARSFLVDVEDLLRDLAPRR
jgi:hypothetical protein